MLPYRFIKEFLENCDSNGQYSRLWWQYIEHTPVYCMGIHLTIAVFPNCWLTLVSKVFETLLTLLFFPHETAFSTLFLFRAVSTCCLCPPVLASQMPVTVHHCWLWNKQTAGFNNQKSIPKLYLPLCFVDPSTFYLNSLLGIGLCFLSGLNSLHVSTASVSCMSLIWLFSLKLDFTIVEWICPDSWYCPLLHALLFIEYPCGLQI